MKRALIVTAAAVVAGASAYAFRADMLQLVPTPLLPFAAHDQYAAGLAVTGIAATPAGRHWKATAEASLANPEAMRLQHERSVRFTGGADDAVSWRIDARRGQRIRIDLGEISGTVFLDLFSDATLERIASAPARRTRLEHVAGRDGPFIARLQPPLGVADSFHIEQQVTASLRFPVADAPHRAVSSAFGDARGGGSRRHEGIDIFAPRETPVIAAADGWVSRQTSNRLGGNVVWLWVPESGVSLYYAHLERRAVRPGDRVSAGDVVGYVGNSGNAATTRPHLHFGIYARGDGAVDPMPYVVSPADAVRKGVHPASRQPPLQPPRAPARRRRQS